MVAELTRACWTSLRKETVSGRSVLAQRMMFERGSSNESMPLSATSCCLRTSFVDAGMVRVGRACGGFGRIARGRGGGTVRLARGRPRDGCARRRRRRRRSSPLTFVASFLRRDERCSNFEVSLLMLAYCSGECVVD